MMCKAFLCATIFALGTSALAADDMTRLARAISASAGGAVITDGELNIGRSAEESSSAGCEQESLAPLKIPFNRPVLGVVGLGNGKAARVMLTRCAGGMDDCLTLTTSDEVPELRSWFIGALRGDRKEKKDVQFTLGEKLYVLRGATPSSWRPVEYVKEPTSIYEIRVKTVLSR